MPLSAYFARESILLTSMNAGPVRTGTAANGVAVIDVQSQGIDRRIALQDRLLVGGPADVAVLNRVNQLGVGSEGVDNRVAIGGLLRLDGGQRDGCVQGHDLVDGRTLLKFRRRRRLHRGHSLDGLVNSGGSRGLHR
jgi:hypothetical protein